MGVMDCVFLEVTVDCQAGRKVGGFLGFMIMMSPFVIRTGSLAGGASAFPVCRQSAEPYQAEAPSLERVHQAGRPCARCTFPGSGSGSGIRSTNAVGEPSSVPHGTTKFALCNSVRHVTLNVKIFLCVQTPLDSNLGLRRGVADTDRCCVLSNPALWQ